MKRKIITICSLSILLAVAGIMLPTRRLFSQVATVPGQVNAVNQYAPATTAGEGGAVTNPAANFILNVAGGPVYCNGGGMQIAQSTLTLQASNTYLVVFNCPAGSVYAKQAVTAPGSQTNQPGVPNSALFAIPNVEVPLATVVCGTTNCGNTSNGSITDARPVSAFPAGSYIGPHLNQAAASATSAGAGTGAGLAGVCTASAATTCIVTFTPAFQSKPVCTVTDESNAIVFKALATTGGLTITAASNSDSWDWICIGNPN